MGYISCNLKTLIRVYIVGGGVCILYTCVHVYIIVLFHARARSVCELKLNFFFICVPFLWLKWNFDNELFIISV